MEPMSESKFNMWRSCVAVVHLDKIVTNEEKKWVEDKSKNLPLSQEQRNILRNDLETGLHFEEAFKKISEKKDLAFLLNTMRVIGFLDKDFSAVEKEKFKKLEDIILKGIDLISIEKEVRDMEIQSYHEDEVYEVANRSSMFEKIHMAFMKFINPGDYKFPPNE